MSQENYDTTFDKVLATKTAIGRLDERGKKQHQDKMYRLGILEQDGMLARDQHAHPFDLREYLAIKAFSELLFSRPESFRIVLQAHWANQTPFATISAPHSFGTPFAPAYDAAMLSDGHDLYLQVLPAPGSSHVVPGRIKIPLDWIHELRKLRYFDPDYIADLAQSFKAFLDGTRLCTAYQSQEVLFLYRRRESHGHLTTTNLCAYVQAALTPPPKPRYNALRRSVLVRISEDQVICLGPIKKILQNKASLGPADLVVAQITGYNGNAELTPSLNGKLFLIRPDNVRSSKECIYLDCAAAVRKSTREFISELVVTRAYSEGEQDLLEEEDENTDERTFLVDEALSFSVQETSAQEREDDAEAGSITLTWWDPAGDEAIYSFVANKSTPLKDIKLFETVVYRCMYERKYQRSGAEATEAELNEFKGIEVDTTPAPEPVPLDKVKGKEGPLFRPDESDSEDELTQHLTDLSLQKQAVPARKLPDPVPAPQSTPTALRARPVVYEMPADHKLLYEDKMEYYAYDRATYLFMIQDKNVTVQVWLASEGKKIQNWLVIKDEAGEVQVSVALTPESGLSFDEKTLSMTFKVREPGEDSARSLLLRCAAKEQFNRMNTSIARFLFEASSGIGSFDKLNSVDQEYTRESYVANDQDDIEMAEADPLSDDEEEVPEAQDESDESEADEEASGDESDSSSGNIKPKPRSKNSQLAVGFREDLSFVVRGDMIGVFKNNSRGGKKLQFMTSITGISTPDGKKVLAPSKVMLHEQDSAMILQDPNDANALYRLDLHTGRVVEQYKVGELDVVNILPEAKFAPTTAEKTFVGHSNNALFRVDPRLSRNQLVNNEYKQYAGKNQFSAAVTTAAGGIAVASEKGDVRFYDALGKNAKTALPALGSPITGVDVTKDGRWVVATTDTFLLLINNTITEGRYAGELGFNRSFPANAKPKPIRLQLRPEHAAHMDGFVKFTPAKFNSGPDAEEKTIVTSSGPFVIAWNFKRVKQGNLGSYTIKRYDDHVVADSFKFNGDKDIVVTLTNDVFLEHKGSLQKPTRDSLGGANIVRQFGS